MAPSSRKNERRRDDDRDDRDDRRRKRRSKSRSHSRSASRSRSQSREREHPRSRSRDRSPEHRKRDLKMEEPSSSKTDYDRRSDEKPDKDEVVDVHAPSKRKRRRWDSATPDGPDASTAMAQAQTLERVRAGGSGLAAVAAAGSALDRAKTVSSALDKAKQAAAIQRQIQERLAGLGVGAGALGTGPRKWAPLLLDKQGRQVDERGNVIVMQRNVDTLKYNINQQLNKFEGRSEGAAPEVAKKKLTHIDPELTAMPQDRSVRKSFRFVMPGKYLARATQMRMKQISREMRLNKREAMDDTFRVPVELDAIPIVEWWDEKILNEESYESEITKEAITHYLHHPVELKPIAELRPLGAMPVMLTEKERKKIKRRNKVEKQKEEQDKIRLGLMKAPEPKMRLSNLMRVLGNDAIMEPSKVEAKVRKQMAARQKAHEKHNESRQLTQEERREKKRTKLKEDTAVQTHVAVFRAGDLLDSKRRYKVEINAQQRQLTGCGVLYGNCNVVVVEGGPKGIKFFKRLMLHRIKWDEENLDTPAEEKGEDKDSDEEEEPKPKAFGKCVLVWEGILSKRAFKTFAFETCRSEQTARKFLQVKGVEHYWDMCRNYKDLVEYL